MNAQNQPQDQSDHMQDAGLPVQPSNSSVKPTPIINQQSPTAHGGGYTPQLSTTQIPLPDEAEDTDLIEKEWVERAKQIVEHTRDDPHEQQRALSQMKADYLKKRYNKDVKAPEV